MERSMEARPFEQTIGKSRRPVLDILVFGSGFGEGASKTRVTVIGEPV